jgi:hypothetical protein
VKTFREIEKIICQIINIMKILFVSFMKGTLFLLAFLHVFVQDAITQNVNGYINFPDTLVLNMVRYPGYGPYLKWAGGTSLLFHDELREKHASNPLTKLLPELKGIPGDIDSIKFSTLFLNFYQSFYELFLKGEVDSIFIY